MAKIKKTPEEKAAAKLAKANKVKRAPKVWLSAAHKAVAGFAATAVGLAKLNQLAGVEGFGHAGAAFKGTEQEMTNAGNMVINKFGSKTGSLYHLPVDSERFKKLRSLAKAAAPDLGGTEKGKMAYSGSVKAFLEELLVGGASGGGGKITSRDNTGLMGAL